MADRGARVAQKRMRNGRSQELLLLKTWEPPLLKKRMRNGRSEEPELLKNVCEIGVGRSQRCLTINM